MEREEKLELLSAYIDGEVTPRELDLAQRLIRDDPEAAAIYERLRKTSSLLNGLQPLEAPKTFHRKLMSRLKPSEKTGFASRLGEFFTPKLAPVPMLTYAGAAVVIVVGLSLLMTFGTLPKEQSVSVDQRGAEVLPLMAVSPDEQAKKKAEEKRGERFAEALPEAEADLDEARSDMPESGTGATADTSTGEDFAALAEAPAPAEEMPPAEGRREMRDVAKAAPSAAVRTRAVESEPLATGSGAHFTANQMEPDALLDLEGGDPAEQFYVSETVTYITERGAPFELDGSAPSGSDANPLSDPSAFLPPRFNTLEFVGRGSTPGTAETPVFVEAHISKDGAIIYMRVIGQRSNSRLIEDLADRLFSTRLIPARGEQDSVSVFYSFVAVIKPAR
ncbi:MAG TPA: hypothetical protein VMX35_14100 [Acidobacteriota bacterium]|nr:hypothetical protein [Acidobacteriota bacterium]